MSLTIENLSHEDTLTSRVEINPINGVLKTTTLVPDVEYIFSDTVFDFEVHIVVINNIIWHSIYFEFKPNNPVNPPLKQNVETITVNSKALFMKNRTFKNDGTCAQVYNSKGRYGFEIDIKMQVLKPTVNKFNDLYDDEAMTDFVLRVDDGCVCFHRVVLALSSPVLKTMVSGKWKETAQGHVEVPGISKNTIQQFKDYIYKSVVPENVSLELLSFASYYMITELEEICVEKIADRLTCENSWSVLEYCASHKFTKLMSVILNRVKYGQIDDKVFI